MVQGGGEATLPPEVRREHRGEDLQVMMIMMIVMMVIMMIYSLELRSDDIFIVSYPKTGTSLTLEMVWMMINDR